MYILKTTGLSSYIVAAPRKNKKEGVCTSDDKFNALQFKTDVAAKAWLADVQTAQRAFGFKSYQLTKAYPVPVRF